MSDRKHWDEVYGQKGATNVSWYQPHLERSLELIRQSGVALDAGIIDVGAGASTLVDDLLSEGFSNITVADLAQSALELSQQRLGARGEAVRWLCGDITLLDLPLRAFDLWHDRAVFHFLTEPADRAAYVRQVCRSVRQGGHVIVATFGPDGPEQCSGLPVVRYASEQLHDELGAVFELVDHLEEGHQTPWGTLQEFVYCWCVKQS